VKGGGFNGMVLEAKGCTLYWISIRVSAVASEYIDDIHVSGCHVTGNGVLYAG
jgi:hypothetical protein